MSVCLECNKAVPSSWSDEYKDWAMLTIVIGIGSQEFRRKGIACPRCIHRWRDLAFDQTGTKP